MHSLRSCFLFIVIVCSCSKHVAKQEAQPKVRLRVASVYPTQMPILGSSILHIAERVQLVSLDSIKMRLMEPQDVGGIPAILDAVSAGKVDAGYSSAGFWSGKNACRSFVYARHGL
jgi:TRAP-type mannitol/chloroaromatic compound transport system substrate-binding protein